MKKKILSATCALALLVNLVPLPAYAIDLPEGAGYTLVFDVTDANGDGWVDAGERVDVTVSIKDAGWATNETEMPMVILRVGFSFNNDLLELVTDNKIGPATPYAATLEDLLTQPNAMGYAFSDNAGDTEKGGLANANEAGEIIVLCDHAVGNYVDLPDEKTPAFTYHFVAKEGVEGQPAFDIISESTTLSVGYVTSNPDDAKTLLDAYQLEYSSIPQVDTLAPTIQVEGAAPEEETTYYYQPLTVSAVDSGSGLASLTLDGAPVEGTVTAGGTLTATDNRGNTATYVLTVDAAAFNAAKDAAAALPETVTYADKEAVETARAALDAVTDPTAQAKLAAETEKVAAAADAIAAIDTAIDAVEVKIGALPAVETLSVKDAPALSEIETALAELEAKNVPTEAISNYAVYTAAAEKLEAVMAEINTVKDLINALPAADEVGYGDEAAVQEAEAALKALYAKYAEDQAYIAEAVGASTLEGIRTALDTLLETQQALIDKIAQTEYKITMFEDDIAVITGLRAEVEAMMERDATFTAEELKPLTDAEAALAELTEQSEAAHAAVAALPEAEDILYGDKGTVADAAAQVAALEGKDTFTEDEIAKLEAAQQAIAVIEEAIGDVEAKISALPAIEELSVKDAAALSAIETVLAELEAKGVPTDAVSNYETYTAAAEQLKVVLAEINAVKEMIAALPAADEVGFGDEAAVKEAEAALNTLYEKYAEDQAYIAEAVGATTLENVRAALDALLQAKADLIDRIQNAEFVISMAEDDRAAITGLRAEVEAMIAQGTRFSDDELANLIQAEEELAELQAQSEAAHAAVAALPEADAVLYTDKAQIEAVAKQVEAMLQAKDTFTQEETDRLSSAQQAVKDIETEIDAVSADMAELTGITEETATVENISAVQNMRGRLEALFAKGVTAGDVNNYGIYEAAYKAVESWLTLVDKAEALANALPEADDVVFGDETAIHDAEDAYAALKEQGLDSLVDAAAVEKLEAAGNALAALWEARAALVDKIAAGGLNITLAQADRDALSALRAEVTAMEAKGTTFTADELSNLTQAESQMAALVERSEAAHAAVAALPARDKVLYTEKDNLSKVALEMDALSNLGDTFTAEETAKLTEAQAGIADLEKAVETLAKDMADLKDPTDAETPVLYADKAELEAMEADITALEARACNVDEMIAGLAAENPAYANSLARYTGYRTAVRAMMSELDALNTEMKDAVNNWVYNDLTAYNAIVEKMNAAAEQYGIEPELYAEVFPDYETIPAKNEEAKAALDSVLEKVDALPDVEDMTLNDADKVKEITDLLEKLKAEYGFTEAMFTENLGNGYAVYQASVDKIEALQAEQKPEGGDQSQDNNNQDQQNSDQEQTATSDTQTPAATAAPTVAAIPQTSDPMNMQLTVLLMGLALCGLVACVVVRRKMNR